MWRSKTFTVVSLNKQIEQFLREIPYNYNFKSDFIYFKLSDIYNAKLYFLSDVYNVKLYFQLCEM